jgi:hypothetical protein
MEGSVLNFLKAQWKVSDTGSVHWASSFNKTFFYSTHNEDVGGYACFTIAVRPFVDKSYVVR